MAASFLFPLVASISNSAKTCFSSTSYSRSRVQLLPQELLVKRRLNIAKPLVAHESRQLAGAYADAGKTEPSELGKMILASSASSTGRRSPDMDVCTSELSSLPAGCIVAKLTETEEE
jgi:hypothetical protein